MGKITSASYTCNFIWKLLTIRGKKYGGFLLNCTKIPLIVLCWKSWQSTLWEDSKIESVGVLLKVRRKKILYNIAYWRNEINHSWLLITQNLMRNKVIIWITHKFLQDNESSIFWMWFCIGFAQRVPVR